MAQYIYTMNRVGKIVPPKREILRDISLSFFPGAKIGVLGLNGSGKSTLLRIMAGIDTDIEGEARPQPGTRIGYLPQEPQLDESKDVRGNLEEALGEVKRALTRLDEVYAAYAEPDADFDALAKEQAELENIIQTSDGHNIERQLEIAADALRLPPWEADVSTLLRRRAAAGGHCASCCWRSPTCCCWTSRPTISTPSRWPGWSAFLHEYSGTVVAVTHDRYFLDNVSGWILELDRGYGIPWEGNYSSWLEQKEARLRAGAEERGGPGQEHETRAGVGTLQPQGAPRQEQGTSGTLRGVAEPRVPGPQRNQRDLHPARRAPRRAGDRGQPAEEGLRRPSALR